MDWKLAGAIGIAIVAVIIVVIWGIQVANAGDPPETQKEVRKQSGAEDPMVELQKLLDEGKAKPLWMVYLEAWFPGFVVVVLATVVVVIIVLIFLRRKNIGRGATQSPEEEEVMEDQDRGRTEEGGYSWRLGAGVFVGLLVLVGAGWFGINAFNGFVDDKIEKAADIAAEKFKKAAKEVADAQRDALAAQAKNVGREILYEAKAIMNDKERRVGASFNEFAKIAFGVWNPYYEKYGKDFAETHQGEASFSGNAGLGWYRLGQKPGAPIDPTKVAVAPPPAKGKPGAPAATKRAKSKADYWR